VTPSEAADFIARYVAARAAPTPGALQALWSPTGSLHYPFTDRPIRGEEITALVELTARASPDLEWSMIGWTHRDDVVVLEWRCSNRYGPRVVTWDGVDKFTLRDGLIVEEVFYTDTAPLHAMKLGLTLEPLMRL
jgi:hypothetical protein